MVEWSFYVYHLPRHGMWLKINFKARKKKNNNEYMAQMKESRATTHVNSIRMRNTIVSIPPFHGSFFISSHFTFYWKWHPCYFFKNSVLILYITCSFYPCQTTNWLQWKYPFLRFDGLNVEHRHKWNERKESVATLRKCHTCKWNDWQ